MRTSRSRGSSTTDAPSWWCARSRRPPPRSQSRSTARASRSTSCRRGETGLDGAPAPLARLAEELGAGSALLIPVVVGDQVQGSLELVHIEGFDRAALAVARLAAAQVGLGIRAFGPVDITESAPWDAHLFRVAGDALASGSDVANGANHVLRLALELSGAEGALLWNLGPDGTFRRSEEAGTTEAVSRLPALGVQELGERSSVSHKLGEPAFGVLQLVFAPDRAPSPELVEVLEEFASRAARTLRAHERSVLLESELERTRSLLAVVGQATRGALARGTRSTRRSTGSRSCSSPTGSRSTSARKRRLTAAVERGLAGPHVRRRGSGCSQLALGPFRGRGLVVVPDVAAERRLAPVRGRLRRGRDRGRTCASRSSSQDDVIGLLAVYPRARARADARTRRRCSRRSSASSPSRCRTRACTSGRRALGERERESALDARARGRAAARARSTRSRARSHRASRSTSRSTPSPARWSSCSTSTSRVDPDARRAARAARSARVPRRRRASGRTGAIDPRSAAGVRPHRDPAALSPWRPDLPRSGGGRTRSAAHTGCSCRSSRRARPARCVPIATPAEVLGALTLLSLDPDRPVTAETIEAALAIAGQAALAIDNARLYQQQKQFADAMQRSLLPARASGGDRSRHRRDLRVVRARRRRRRRLRLHRVSTTAGSRSCSAT